MTEQSNMTGSCDGHAKWKVKSTVIKVSVSKNTYRYTSSTHDTHKSVQL